MITQEKLKKFLHYNPETGEFIWKKRTSGSPEDARFNSRWEGAVAGCATRHSHVICIELKYYVAHHLAWLYMTGSMPRLIDHIDGDPFNNRFSNLRPATKAENNRNAKISKNNSSGMTGVIRRSNVSGDSWIAYYTKDYKNHHVGCFRTAEEALEARVAAVNKAFGDFSPYKGAQAQ